MEILRLEYIETYSIIHHTIMPEHKSLSEKIQQVQPYLVAVGLLGISIVGATYFAEQYPIPESIQFATQITAGMFHTMGRVADIISTVRLSEKADEIEERLDIDTTVKETASLLPIRPKLKDILKPGIIAIELGQIIPITIFPPVGILTGAKSFYAASHNNRL